MTETSLVDTDKLDRVRDESFYGQTRISLAAIEDALTQSRALTGSTDQVRDFTCDACVTCTPTSQRGADVPNRPATRAGS